MQGVKIGNKNTWIDWQLRLVSVQNNLPVPKTAYVDIPFSNGSLDLTEAFSQDVVYENRKITFEFDTFLDWEQQHLLIEKIGSYLHGQKHILQLPNDSQYYYSGRLSINQYKTDKTTGNLIIEALCDPYRYKNDVTIIEQNLSATPLTINCQNSRKRVIPTFTVSSQTIIKYKDNNYVIGVGTHTITNIILIEGDNLLTVSSIEGGTIEIKYQEGAL